MRTVIDYEVEPMADGSDGWYWRVTVDGETYADGDGEPHDEAVRKAKANVRELLRNHILEAAQCD